MFTRGVKILLFFLFFTGVNSFLFILFTFFYCLGLGVNFGVVFLLNLNKVINFFACKTLILILHIEINEYINIISVGFSHFPLTRFFPIFIHLICSYIIKYNHLSHQFNNYKSFNFQVNYFLKP